MQVDDDETVSTSWSVSECGEFGKAVFGVHAEKYVRSCNGKKKTRSPIGKAGFGVYGGKDVRKAKKKKNTGCQTPIFSYKVVFFYMYLKISVPVAKRFDLARCCHTRRIDRSSTREPTVFFFSDLGYFFTRVRNDVIKI